MKTIVNRINWSYFPKTNPIPHELDGDEYIQSKNITKHIAIAEELIKKGKKNNHNFNRRCFKNFRKRFFRY